MIIGIAGTLGAGKGTVVDHLKLKGFAHYSVSGRLIEILKERELLEDRPNMSILADELSDKYVGGILEVMYLKAKEDGVENYILESIHRESEAKYVRSLGGIILALDVDPHVRYERSQLRQEGEKDNVTFEEFLAAIEREEKGKGDGKPNINAIIESADHVIMNDGSIKELHAKVEEWLPGLEK
jgi:dephospho-CoA kinase